MVKKSRFGILALLVGIVLMGISLGVYYFVVNTFLREVHSEVFGVGVGLFIIGLSLITFGRRLG